MADGVNPEYFWTEISWWRWPLRWLHSICLRPVQIWRQKNMFYNCIKDLSQPRFPQVAERFVCSTLTSFCSVYPAGLEKPANSSRRIAGDLAHGQFTETFVMGATRPVWIEVFRWAWFQGHQCWLFSYLEDRSSCLMAGDPWLAKTAGRRKEKSIGARGERYFKIFNISKVSGDSAVEKAGCSNWSYQKRVWNPKWENPSRLIYASHSVHIHR